MQIDRNNFKEFLPQILQKIQHADFIAFDCQFTGLAIRQVKIQGAFSNHIQFYQRIKQTAYNFRIIQLGLATFIYEQNVYKPTIYNFYITPSTFTEGYNNIMLCEIQSMQFLAENQLNFSQVFSCGIKNCRLQSIYQTKQKKYYQDHQLESYQISNLFLSPDQQKIITNIQQYLTQENIKEDIIVDFQNKIVLQYFNLKYPCIGLEKGKKKMKPFEYIVKGKNKEKNKIIETEIITNATLTSQKEGGNNTKKQQKQQQGNQIVGEQCPGLEKVINALILSKKPLVGHYLALDIGLIFQNFIKDLPETYQQFCQNINKLFPYLFDSKVISKRLQQTLKGLRIDLSSLFKACSNKKLLKPYANFDITGLEYYKEKQHEAGYDAFITGCSFIAMVNYLNRKAQRINFQCIEKQNMLLYSRCAGQVSLSGNGYASNAINYSSTIIIQPFPKIANESWKSVAKKLSRFGSLTVYEDQGETYYVYEESQNIEEIIKQFPDCQLKKYEQRKIIRARNMYS